MPVFPADRFKCALPWRAQCQFELLIDAEQFYPRILQSIEQSQFQIDLEMYLVQSGTVTSRFITALAQARQRNVRVRLLLDHVGSLHLSSADQQRLRQAGIEVRLFNQLQHHKWIRNFFRDHRKIIIVDQKLALTGGAGLSDDFGGINHTNGGWRDIMVGISGEPVRDWQMLFERTWHYYDNPQDQPRQTGLATPTGPTSAPPLQNGEITQARVVASRGPGNKPIIASLVSHIRKARQTAWISTAYFYPSRKLVKALVRAASKGVDVRLLLPGNITDHPSIRYAGRTWYRKLLRSGVRIFEYQPRFLHMKLAVVDDWSTVGSCNFDRWNLRWNLEANQEIIDPGFACEIRAMLQQDLQHTREIHWGEWVSRHWSEKILERFWKWVGRFLARIPYD